MSVLEQLFAAQIVGVVRDGNRERARQIARGLAAGGLGAVEITANTPGAFASVEALADEHPAVVWGIGTVRTMSDIERAADCGARFVVSPHADPVLIREALDRGLVPIPGAMTPTEICTAHGAGAPVVKVFPVSAVGGPRFLNALRGPLPDIPLWVSGNVALDEIGAYRDAGAALIGLTSALTADLDAPFEAAAEARARRARAAITPAVIVIDGTARIELGRADVAERGEAARLADWIPGRPGRVFRVEPWLREAGFTDDDAVRVRSSDGFTTTLPARTLLESGAIQVDVAGTPLGPAEGGPFRLYVRGTGDRCDNVKRLVALERTSGST